MKQNSHLLCVAMIACLWAYTPPTSQLPNPAQLPTEPVGLQQPLGELKLPTPAPAGQLIDKILASVDEQPILQSELEAEYQLYQAQKKIPKVMTKCAILQNIIIDKILLDAAQKQSIEVQKDEIDMYVNYRMETIIKEIGSVQALEQYIAKPVAEFKTELRKSIKEQITIERVRHSIVSDVTVSPSEVHLFFQELAPAEIPFFPARVEAYQLVRYPTVGKKEKEILLSQLESLKNRIRAGEDFATLAKQYSHDVNSATYGGELGFFKVGELDPDYEKTALSLVPGEVADPIETKFGIHLIQLIEHRKGQYNSRHILLKPVASEPDLQAVITQLDNIRTEIIDKKLTFEKAVTIYSEDTTTAQKNGLVTASREGIYMAVDQLPPDLFFILDPLQAGTISKPTTFTNAMGTQGVRLVYLKEKIPAHAATLTRDYEQIHQMALEAKKQKVFDDWLAKAKQKALIQLDAAYQECQ